MSATAPLNTVASPETPVAVDFLSNILTPGSSLHPTFQLLLDGAFAFLFFVLAGLVILTRGNLHVIALIAIEGCLWMSVKWFVHELQSLKTPAAHPSDSKASEATKEE